MMINERIKNNVITITIDEANCNVIYYYYYLLLLLLPEKIEKLFWR